MGGYLRGTTIVALIDAAGIGATVTGIFAVLVAYVTSGAGPAIALAVAVVVVQQVEGNLLQPLIMGKVLKLHPMVILLALGVGAVLAGFVGAVLAVPACAVVWAAIKAWNEKAGRGAHPVEAPTQR